MSVELVRIATLIRAAGMDLALRANRARRGHRGLEHAHLGQHRGIVGSSVLCTHWVRPEGDRALALREARQALPQILGHVRHERMQESQRGLEHAQENLAGLGLFRLGRLAAQLRLGDLEVPVAKIRPEEPVDVVHALVDSKRVERLVHGLRRLGGPRLNPAAEEGLGHEVGGGRRLVADQLGDQPRGIPDLVEEVAVALDALRRQGDALVGRRERGQREAQGIGAKRRKPGAHLRRRRIRLLELGERLGHRRAG